MIKIITDSSADLCDATLRALDIDVLPITVLFGTEEYLDGVTIDKETFYRKLAASKELPKTSQVNQAAFEEAYARYDCDILSVHISSELSGTARSAAAAKQSLGRDNIEVIDSRSVTFGLGAILAETAKRITPDTTLAEAKEICLGLCARARLLAVIGDLKYLRQGGRLTPTAAVIGTVLNVKPVISVVNGKVVGIHKALGVRRAYDYIVKHARARDRGCALYFGHTDALPALTDFVSAYGGELEAPQDAPLIPIGCTVGTHAGPGALGVVYFEKESV